MSFRGRSKSKPDDNPGPGAYYTNEKLVRPTSKGPIFRPTSAPRLNLSMVSDGPDPGTYETQPFGYQPGKKMTFGAPIVTKTSNNVPGPGSYSHGDFGKNLA